MRRIAPAVLFLAVAGLALLIVLRRPEPDAPQFLPPPSDEVVRSYVFTSYEFLSSSPFEGGKMWLLVLSGATNFHSLLFDIEQRRVLGELTNAEPVFMNHSQARLLCVNRSPSSARTLRGILTRLVERTSWGRIRLPMPSSYTEVFWVLDLEKNEAVRIGEVSQAQGAGSSFSTSPDFRFGFTTPTASRPAHEIVLCDLEKKTFTTINAPSGSSGWWDNQTIVIKDPKNNFVLHDVVTSKTSSLISVGEISNLLSGADIPDADPGRANLFTIWNGRENDFYLTDTHKKWLATNSFLARVEHSSGKLKLLDRDFKFEWSDHLDVSGTLYLHSGRTPGDRSSAVLLRNLKQNTTTTLVESDGGKQFSIPRFYGNSAIYVRSNTLWRIDLNGSNNTRLFPPLE